MLERGKKRILRCIGGEIVIAKDAQGGVEERILIMQDERIESIEVAALRGLDEGGFVHCFFFVSRFAILNSGSQLILIYKRRCYE